MTDQPYTPDTERVAGLYAAAVHEFNVGGPVPDPDAEFDRWHAAEIAAAEQRGAVKALREARHDWYKHADQMDHAPGKYYAGLWMKERAELLESSDE